MENKYNFSVGRRKTATAQVRLFEGAGESMINGKKVGEYITRKDLFDNVFSPLRITKLKDKFYFEVKVSGSGESAQSEAIMYAISKAIGEKDETLKKILKSAGLITSDGRQVERKKPGRHKARKSIQWSKR
ncbi:30S ribosomal protein S9 [Candidatus Gracilibacteria bacterium]|nr:30S ribosomal protein S9 [Candidatus Gracilibacteria bacterium]NUJ98773.1 30S ribosomal protein S9 [Candidatus Gracilibacteria bacterium]